MKTEFDIYSDNSIFRNRLNNFLWMLSCVRDHTDSIVVPGSMIFHLPRNFRHWLLFRKKMYKLESKIPMEDNEAIPSASIILCLTVISTTLTLYLICIIKTVWWREPWEFFKIEFIFKLQNVSVHRRAVFLSLVQMEHHADSLQIRALLLYLQYEHEIL